MNRSRSGAKGGDHPIHPIPSFSDCTEDPAAKVIKKNKYWWWWWQGKGMSWLRMTLQPSSSLSSSSSSSSSSLSHWRGELLVLLLVLTYSALFLSPYSTTVPKRLWVQHVERTIESLDGTRHYDHGLWISAMDKQGLLPLQQAGISQALDSKNLKAASCDRFNGDCYMKFPWYFPVADGIRDSMYIPTAEPPRPLSPTFQFSLSSKPRLMHSQSEDTQIQSQSQKQTPSQIQAQIQAQTQAKTRTQTQTRLLHVHLQGPSHMTLVLRDGAQGRRVLAWNLDVSIVVFVL